jgi:diguanylate cyclase (GGDEF)-like protein
MATSKKVIEEDDTLDDVYHRLGREFRHVVGLEEFIIFEVEKNAQKMKAAYPFLLSHEEIHCHEDILVNSDLCRARKTGHQVSSLSYPGMCRQFRADTGKEHICLPMIVGGSTGGVVQFLFGKNGGAKVHTDAIDRKVFSAAQYIQESLSVIEAKKLMNTLRESAIKDSLTGLYNRRFLQDYTETLVAGALRRGKAIGLIMCDLDYFKQVNDTYGHDVGDAILRETAATLVKCVRKTDFVLRFGGEEFLVVLVDVEEGEALTIAEKIRTTLAAKKLKVPDGTLSKTISLGICEFPTDTEGIWQAIKYADVALYEAKHRGRNLTVRFASEMWTEAKF